jgi:hypothetical protein
MLLEMVGDRTEKHLDQRLTRGLRGRRRLRYRQTSGKGEREQTGQETTHFGPPGGETLAAYQSCRIL